MSETWKPSDGGLRAWILVICAFLANGIVLGVVSVYSIIYVELLEFNKEQNIPNIASKASLVLSLRMGVFFLSKPIGGILVDLVGYRVTGVLGSFISAISLISSSYLLHSLPWLYFTFSVLSGVGSGLVDISSIPILGFYFKKHLGLVNGLVTGACSIFGCIYPEIIKFILSMYALDALLRIFAAIMLFTCIFAFVYAVPDDAPVVQMSGKIMNTAIWRNKKYVVWCATLPLAWFGYYLPFVHIVKYAELNFPTYDGYTLIICLNISSFFSRILIGMVADKGIFDTVKVQQGAFLMTGLFTMLVPAVKTWPLMITIILMVGLCNGGVFCLVGPIATKLCGVTGAVQAIGFMYGINTLPSVAGPTVAGILFDVTQSYEISFYLTGGCMSIAAVLMTAIHFMPESLEARRRESITQLINNEH